MIDALRKLGLSDLEARCYLALHGQPLLQATKSLSRFQFHVRMSMLRCAAL